MKKLLKYINDEVLVKAANLQIATIITKIFAGIITSKAIAFYIGVEGMALIGNIRNFVSAIQSFAMLGFYNGLVKSIARFKNDSLQLSKTLSTAYYLGFFTTIMLSFFCYYNAQSINEFLFSENYNYAYVIKILALALPFYSLNMFSFSIMNGFTKYKMLLIISIFGQVVGLLISIVLIYQENIDGALIAAVIAPSLVFLMTFVGFMNQRSLVPLIKVSNVSLDVLKKFSPYAVMALVSAVALPLVTIIIRNYISDTVGMKEAGYWEATHRVSDYYLMFIMAIITFYILPRFKEIDSIKEFRGEVFNFYKTVIPVFAISLLAIYFLRFYIINAIFSEDFEPSEVLFGWQLLGDFIKVLSVVIAYQFIAKKMFWHFIIIELFLVVMLYFSSIFMIDIYGVKGAVIGHFASYLMHYIIILFVFGSSLFGVIPEEKE